MKSFILLLLLSLTACRSSTQENISIQEFNFDGIFGTTAKDSTSVYCLLGIGYFLAPSADNIDSVITNWIEAHPNALVKSVYTSGPSFSDDKNSNQTYCWIIDGDENLNIWLVQQGCTHGQNMQYPTQEIKQQLGMDQIDGEELSETIHIDKTEYDKFIELAKTATQEASNNKLGIWKPE